MISPRNRSRIGGDFEITPALVLAKRGAAPSLRLPELPCLWTGLGRSALLIAAAAIRHRGGRPRVWLPAFACGSVSQPFLQAGFELKYYSGSTSLTGEESPLPQPDTGDTLLFIHYFGHPNKVMLKIAAELRAAGVWIIEDAVQASLAPGLVEHSDFAVTSYRKFLPVIDGAVLISRSPVDLLGIGLELSPPDETFVSGRLVAKILRGVNAAASDFLALLDRTEGSLEGTIVPRQTSWLSSWVMGQLDLDGVIARRRANWLTLSQRIADSSLAHHVHVVFNELEDDVVPLGFPVRVADGRRDDLRAYLREKDIFCAMHWPLDHLPANEAFERERGLERSLLTLPVDQRMSVEDVHRLVVELTGFFRRA